MEDDDRRMSVETLILRVSSEESSPSSPVPDSAPCSAPFLAEEAYPLILHSLMDIGLGDQVCLTEDHIGEISRAAGTALFTPDSVFSQFLVVPRVEHAITVLLWRLRVSVTCSDHSPGLPTVPVHVLASSLSGLLDNTKLYKGTKQHPAPIRRLALDPHRLPALPSPVSSPIQTPMTPPDSVAGDSTPVPSGLPTKRSVKFRPPPIITRATPGRGPKSAGAGPITLNFAAAALAEYQIEALDYRPNETESPKDKAPSSPSKLTPPSPSKLTHTKIPHSPSKFTAPPIPPQPPSRPASPTKSVRPRSRPPSPNPPRPASPTKRLKKPPPVKRSKSLTGKSKKSKDKEKDREEPKWVERANSMWTPAGVEAHYRNDSSVRTLGLGGRVLGVGVGVGDNGEVSSGGSGVPTPSASALGTPTMSALGTPTMSALGTSSASATGTPSTSTPLLPGAVITPFEPEDPVEEPEEPETHISIEAPTPCASPKPSIRISAHSVDDGSSREDSTVEGVGLSPLRENGSGLDLASGSREKLASGSREHLDLASGSNLLPNGSWDELASGSGEKLASGSRENLGISRENLAHASNGSRDDLASGSREKLASGSRENLGISRENLLPNGSRDELAPSPRRVSPEIHSPAPRTPTRTKRVSITDPRTPSPGRSVVPGSSLHVLNSPDSRSVYSSDLRSDLSPDYLRSDLSPGHLRSDLLRSPASSMYRLGTMGSPSPRPLRDGSPGPRSILRNSLSGSPAPRNGPLDWVRATSPLGRAASPSPSLSLSTRSRTISVSGASLVRSRTVSGASLRNRTVSSSESTRHVSEVSRMRTISDVGRTSEESSIQLRTSEESSIRLSRRASIESARRASIESAQRATMSSPRRTSLEGVRGRSSMDKHRMSVDLDGITIIAVSIADAATPVTPTPKRTGFNLDPDGYLTPTKHVSPGAMSLGTGTPNFQLGSPGLLSHLSPGALSISTVPSLSPFPESEDGDFGFRDGEEDATVTRRVRDASPRRANSPRRNQSPVRAESPKPKRRPLPPPPQGSPTRNTALRMAASPTLTGRGTPTRQLGMPPRSWTDSPSRASTSTHQTLGVPMTQVSSRPRTISTQARPTENGVSESEAESLAFPGSTSTLSLPGDVSLSEVSPFTAPKELESSSESERPSPWIGPGVTSSPWIGPRAPSSSSSSPWMGAAGIELLGSGLLMNSSLPKLTESPRTSVETSRPKSTRSKSGSVLGHERAASGSVTGHERNGSSSYPSSEVGHSRPGSTSGHSRTGSSTHPGLGLRAGQDILVPMLSSRTFSRSDVVRLVGRGDSFGSTHEETTSPTRSGLDTVSEYNQPMPVFMVPGADPTKVASLSRPKSMAHVDEVASEDRRESVILNQDGEAMVRTTEVGVGAGRARVQTGVGVGVSRARGGSVIKSKVDSGLRRRVDSGKSEPRARVDSTKSNDTRPSVTRPKIDSNLRSRMDNVRRKPLSSASQSPTVSSPVSPSSTSTTSARRILIRKASSEAPSRTRKSSATSMRKSSTSSLRSTPPTTVSSPSARKSNRTTSISSGASTPRSSTPRSSGAFSPRSRTTSGGANATPKAVTPRTSISSGRSSIASPKSNLSKSSMTPPKTHSGPATPKAAPRPLPPRPGPPPPARPQRSALRPGLCMSVTAPPVISQPSPATTATPTTPTRIRAVTMDTKATSPTESDPRPRRNTSISSKTPPVSRSGVSTLNAAPPVKSRFSNRNSVHAGTEQADVPFPSPESRDSLQVPETPRALKRSLSVSSAARKLVGRGRAESPVPPNPPVDTNSLAHSTDASSIERSPQKAPRSLSRLAFSALLPRRGGNNAAAEAKAALAQAKAREVAEAKARAKAAAEDAKARAKAEAEEAKAARAAKAKEEKEAKKNSKRFGSISRRGGQS